MLVCIRCVQRIDKGKVPRGDAQSYRPLFGGGRAAESAALYSVRLASLARPTLEAGAKSLNMRRLVSPNAIGGYAITAEEEKGPQRKLRAVPRWFCGIGGEKSSLLVASLPPQLAE
jgi:hypothetical protein